MSSLSAVRNAARFVLEAVAEPGHLNILILNAGLVFAQSGGTTAEGYEPHMGVNYMANALLIRMLLPALKRAPGRNGRVVLVSSIAARLAWLGLETGPPDPAKFKDAKTPIGRSYARSKVAGVLYAIELAKRNQDDLTVLVIHPGIVDTPGTAKASLLHRTVLYIFGLLLYGGYTTPEDGCKNYLWACMAKRETVESGGFYGPVGRREKGTWHDGNEAARKVLWEWTEREVEVYAEV
ncbi:NAD(P)-binding protein [Gonapodya prolifera JEL478]|uniref:NAD(P)-binding protein n=1 Tax=Gonapodya prolifera (strain JEL478) TaxID=1344416 RepID=A0A139AC34_GONPJ|nr:NAD(P)-binding protein [Gonapodya prolifera JEL478]|eukprot:KXS14356.1 NAD(P)-binding protein [Gonapodya prolifera JEL478]